LWWRIRAEVWNSAILRFECLQTESLSEAQKAPVSVSFGRPQKPDVFEVLMLARRRVFVRCSDDEYLIVSALIRNVSLMRFCFDQAEPLSITYHEQTAEQLQLFDGKAWDLPALINWLNSLEE
jgi:hypothetical protein